MFIIPKKEYIIYLYDPKPDQQEAQQKRNLRKPRENLRRVIVQHPQQDIF